MSDEKVLPPHDIEAEMAVLGCVTIDQDSIHEVPQLTGAHFYRRAHGIVFDTMRSMVAEGVSPDVVTLPGRLRASGLEFDEADVIDLTLLVPTSVGIKGYAQVVLDAHVRREAIRAAGEVATVAYDTSQSVSDVVKSASKALLSVAGGVGQGEQESVKEMASKAYDEVLALNEAGGKMQGVSSGYDGVDKIVRGFQGSRLYILGARPGMGKTAWATMTAINAARAGSRVVFYTLEMSPKQLLMRMATQVARVSYSDITEGNLTEAELVAVGQAMGELSTLPLDIHGTTATSSGAYTPGQIYSDVMRRIATGGVDLIFIDYLQLMIPDERHASRVLEVGALSRALAKMSIKLDLPIIALAQLSRSLERRDNKRPTLTDLRDSGEVEQDAALVAFLYRAEYYYKEPDDEEGDDLDYVPGKTEFIVAKNRYGPTGTAYLNFEGFSGRFSEYVPVEHRLPGPPV